MAIEKQLSRTEELHLPSYIFLEMLGKFAHDALRLSFMVNKICTLTPVDSWIPVPNVGACRERYFSLLATKVEPIAATHTAQRWTTNTSVSMEFKQLLTNSRFRDPLPNIVCYIVGYTAILHHATIIWWEAIWCNRLTKDRTSWWYMHMCMGLQCLEKWAKYPKSVFKRLRVEHCNTRNDWLWLYITICLCLIFMTDVGLTDVYVTDRFAIWTILKRADGFKTGWPVLKLQY